MKRKIYKSVDFLGKWNRYIRGINTIVPQLIGGFLLLFLFFKNHVLQLFLSPVCVRGLESVELQIDWLRGGESAIDQNLQNNHIPQEWKRLIPERVCGKSACVCLCLCVCLWVCLCVVYPIAELRHELVKLFTLHTRHKSSYRIVNLKLELPESCSCICIFCSAVSDG